MTFRIDDDSHKRLPQNKPLTERIAGEGVEVMTRGQSYNRLLIEPPNPPVVSVFAVDPPYPATDTAFPEHTAADPVLDIQGIIFSDNDEYFYAIARYGLLWYVVRSRYGDVWDRIGSALPASCSYIVPTKGANFYLINSTTVYVTTNFTSFTTVYSGSVRTVATAYSWFHDTFYFGQAQTNTTGTVRYIVNASTSSSHTGFTAWRMDAILADRRKASQSPLVVYYGYNGTIQYAHNWNGSSHVPGFGAAGAGQQLVGLVAGAGLVATADWGTDGLIVGSGIYVATFNSDGTQASRPVHGGDDIKVLIHDGSQYVAFIDADFIDPQAAMMTSANGTTWAQRPDLLRGRRNLNYVDVGFYPVNGGADRVVGTIEARVLFRVQTTYSGFEFVALPGNKDWGFSDRTEFDGQYLISHRTAEISVPRIDILTGQLSILYDGVPSSSPAIVDNGGVLISNGGIPFDVTGSVEQQLHRSVDGGATWSLAGPDHDTLWDSSTDLVVSQGRFVLTGRLSGASSVGRTWSSADGLIWTETTPAGIASSPISGRRYLSAEFAEDDFVYVQASGGSIYISFDGGQTWSSGASPTAGFVSYLIRFDGMYYALSSGQLYVSANLSSWSSVVAGDGNILLLFRTQNALVFVDNTDEVLHYSKDGVLWQQIDLGLSIGDSPNRIAVRGTQAVSGRFGSSSLALVSNL